MAFARRGSQRFTANVWPGFVDAMGALLMVLIFVLSIFMILQSVMRDTISSKDQELTDLNTQLSGLAQSLALERARTTELGGQLDAAKAQAASQETLIATLSSQVAERNAALDAAGQRITAFEAQVASLISDRDATAEAIRLDKATIEELRDRLKGSGDELAAMTLQLEDARRRAEETLTLLAAADAAKEELQSRLNENLTEAERAAALRATAEKALQDQRQTSDRNAERVTLLNAQVAALRTQLNELQGILDAAQAKDAAADVQMENLGSQLNAALAQVAAEQRRRAALEEAARIKAEEEAKDLAKYRSEFFGRMSDLMQGREGVRVVGDRFVFSSEVLFQPGNADLSEEGRAQIARVAQTFRELSAEIPPEIDWVLEVDGFTDNTPLSGQGQFRDNWELSQARALSVVRYLISALGFPPHRLAAAGFGEFSPVAEGNSPEARAANRRIELKLTER
ncbi:peptidoglycan -binding protein [Paenirhodobacter populi]|uniref:Peptidoglycan-binding protein n=1 Tax=Paenirhodobacter populi TaxID=2306993 RepID=A0A443JMD3_9RHOB|nr:peptidoglycan -binding protein [Sinirhodobacter populi]RWR21653.1 peptidoglycan -binding protein [Sinirhodobacter populi]